jgi:hypothetical protein
MEQTDYVTMRAPKPTLICTGTQDFFDIQGSWTTFREAKKIYGMIGHAERVDLIEYNDKHGFSKPRREAAMRWMRRWLMGVDDAPVEGDFPVFKDAELQCTTSGQVLADLKGKSVFDLNAEREKALVSMRPGHSGEGLAVAIRRRLGIPGTVGAAEIEFSPAAIARTGYGLVKGTATVQPGLRIGLLATQIPKPGPMALHVSGDGKGAAVAPGGAFEQDAKLQIPVVALDLRGMGETAPIDKSPFGPDWKEAFLGIHLNRPLLGQRVRDLLAVGNRLDGILQVHASGAAVPTVLHAAVLTPEWRQITLEGGLLSWSLAARTPITQNQLANVVPGVLEDYDLPDLAAALAPRKLTIRNPVDAAGKKVTSQELEAAYARARAAYKAAGAEANLVLEARP